MKSRYVKFIVLGLWVIIAVYLYLNNLIPRDQDQIKSIIEGKGFFSDIVFLLLSIGRIVLFIPGIIFIILGGLCFKPLKGFLLSMISLSTSQSLVYLAGKYFSGDRVSSYIKNKYKDLILYTEKYGYKFLGLSIMCPILPSDAVCFIAGVLNFNYKKYLFTIILCNLPFVSVYSILSGSSLNSHICNAILCITLFAIFTYTLITWRNIKRINSQKS